MIAEFQFGEWLPDRVDYNNPGLEICRNVIPSPRGYQPAKSAVSEGTTVSGALVGASGFERADGTPVIVAATVSDLYVIVSGTSFASSLSLSLTTADQVSFAQFNSKIYATTKNGDMWVLDNIESDTTFASATGSPPSANAIGRISDFLVVGDLNDIDSSDAPYRIRWSQFNNPDGTWGTDIATQTGAVDLDAQQGPVTAISGGSFGMVFQKNGISRLTYTGGGAVFDLELYEKNRGCVAPKSVVRVGDVAYFLSTDGFFATDGTSVQSISQGKTWEWFVQNIDQTNLKRVIGATHWESRCVVWLVPTSDTTFQQMWWNWETGSWSTVDEGLTYIVETGLSGLSLEEVSAIYPNLDTMGPSLDSSEFLASGRALGGFVEGVSPGAYSDGYSDGYAKGGSGVSSFVSLTGSSLEAELGGGSLQFKKGRRTYVRSVTPLIEIEDAAITVALECRDKMTQSSSASTSAIVGNLGFSPFSHDARYFRCGFTIPAGAAWSDAYGYQIDYSVGGRT